MDDESSGKPFKVKFTGDINEFVVQQFIHLRAEVSALTHMVLALYGDDSDKAVAQYNELSRPLCLSLPSESSEIIRAARKRQQQLRPRFLSYRLLSVRSSKSRSSICAAW